MFTIHLDNDKILYLQIYEHIKEEISSGRLESQEKLPSRRSLADHLGVSLNTVIQAYEQLLEEGYIISKERSGYYVDKLNIETLEIPPRPIEFSKEETIKEYTYDFSYDGVDSSTWSKMPSLSLLRDSFYESIEIKSTPNFGLWSLRVELANYLRNYRGVIADPRDIVIITGYNASLSLLFSILDNKVYGLEDPGYQKTESVFKGARRELVRIPVDQYGLSVYDLEKTEASIAIATPNHQFPTGIIMGIRRRQRLLNWALEKDGRYILEDDYDSDFKYSGKPIPALKSLDKEGKVILTGSFSQVVGPALRMSYMVLPRHLTERLERETYSYTEISIFEQVLFKNILKSDYYDRQLNRLQTLYRKKREKLIQAIKDWDKAIEIKGANAGLHFILEIKEPIPKLDVLKERAQEKDIYLKSISDYSKEKDNNNHEFIIGFGALELDQIETAAKALYSLFF